ncbi:MAG: hypothetical protein H6821_05840 [Planctomycetaceae bacterium]|nr:hypothetical protein [Planctomycetales bacterium]MCB9873683.1 hypothetical protein [Planctomycetaceae bacterium]MCB9940935.1 hypothetical protein [Planctomycetaceae bacterium]
MNRWHLQTLVLFLVTSLMFPASDIFAEPVPQESPPYATKSIRGRVVWLAEAMTRLHGIKSVPEAGERVLALESDDGKLYPIVEDIRGRAFRRDERLRKMKVELLVRQYPGLPPVQILRVFELAEDGKYDVDYWCEICSIAMFELKECECCQGPIEFRRQKVAEPATE